MYADRETLAASNSVNCPKTGLAIASLSIEIPNLVAKYVVTLTSYLQVASSIDFYNLA